VKPIDYLEAIAAIGSLTAAYILSEGHMLQGWIVTAIFDILLLTWAYLKNAYWFMFATAAFFLIALNGIGNAL